jgi:hypothetical protein
VTKEPPRDIDRNGQPPRWEDQDHPHRYLGAETPDPFKTRCACGGPRYLILNPGLYRYSEFRACATCDLIVPPEPEETT